MAYVQQVLDKINELHYGSLALVVGRYYAMDRDKRFERNKIAYEGMVQGIGEEASPDTVIDVWKSTVYILNFDKISFAFYRIDFPLGHSFKSLFNTNISFYCYGTSVHTVNCFVKFFIRLMLGGFNSGNKKTL